MSPQEALIAHPPPWRQSNFAHHGHFVYDANDNLICDFNATPAGVALAGVIVEIVNHLSLLAPILKIRPINETEHGTETPPAA